MQKKKYFDRRLKLLFVFFCGVLAVSAALQTQDFGESILIDQPASEDLYLAAKNIDVLASVDNDVVAAGRRITIGGQVGGDLITASENLTIQGTILDDLRAAGRNINVTGVVAGHMVAAGQSIFIGADADIGNWAWLAGESVDLTGTVRGNIKVAASRILIDGEIAGDAELIAEDIRIGPNGVIQGNLRWRSPNPLDQSESAQINGQIVEIPFPEDWAEDEEEEGNIGESLFVILSLAISAIAIYLLLPRYSKETAELLRTDCWKSLGIGAIYLFATPLVAVLLIATAIGSLLGIALFGAYLFLLIFGLLMAVIALSSFALRMVNKSFKDHGTATKWTWVMAILVTTIAIVLIGKVPLIGGLFFVLLWVYGLGSVNLRLFRSCCRTQEN